MRLLFIRQNYPPERGAVRYVRDLAVEMVRRGHMATVITGLPNYPLGRPYPGHGRFLPTRRMEDGVRIIRTPQIMASNRQPFKRLAGFLSFPCTALPASLACGRPDVVICSVPPVTVGPLGFLLARMWRIPLVFLLHDYEPLRSFELRGLADSPFARFLVGLFTRLYCRAERIVVTIETELEAMRLREASADRIEVIRHGVDADRFRELARPEPPLTLPRRAGRRLALYTGTLGVAHDVERVIELFARPGMRQLPLDLVVIGDGECAPLCHSLVKDNRLDNVRLLPPVPLEWVPALQSRADLLLLSQKPELFSVGSKFYEYLAAGKPILANSTGILARTVRRLGNGWVFNASEPDSLEESVRQFLAMDENTLEGIGERSLSAARGEFGIRQRHDRWEELLSGLAARQ